MRSIFERGYFRANRVHDSHFSTVQNRTELLLENRITSNKTKVFLSHKHSDLDELKDLIGFLESKYNVDVYIDSMDKAMPSTPSGATATRIKKVIQKCDKFILLATNDAVESKWCNWELGFGDAQKFRDDIAILPIKEKGSYDYQYKGKEYMSIYPHIFYYNGTERYATGRFIAPGYYYGYVNDDSGATVITPLSDWLRK
jgi:MTH538 TIR-like domain (DUF1863).